MQILPVYQYGFRIGHARVSFDATLLQGDVILGPSGAGYIRVPPRPESRKLHRLELTITLRLYNEKPLGDISPID